MRRNPSLRTCSKSMLAQTGRGQGCPNLLDHTGGYSAGLGSARRTPLLRGLYADHGAQLTSTLCDAHHIQSVQVST